MFQRIPRIPQRVPEDSVGDYNVDDDDDDDYDDDDD